MKKHLLLAALLAGFTVHAEPVKDYPKVDDTSYSEPNGNRVIRLSTEIAASPEEIWRIFSTAEGWKSFAVVFASMDMQVGGILETSYDPKARKGDVDNIKNQIVAYVPGRLLAFRCVQTPRDFAHKEEFLSTATVVEIAPGENEKSRVSMTAVGYRPGEAYDTLYKHFRWGDAYTLEKLRLKFEPGPSSAVGQAVDKNSPKPKSEVH